MDRLSDDADTSFIAESGYAAPNGVHLPRCRPHTDAVIHSALHKESQKQTCYGKRARKCRKHDTFDIFRYVPY